MISNKYLRNLLIISSVFIFIISSGYVLGGFSNGLFNNSNFDKTSNDLNWENHYYSWGKKSIGDMNLDVGVVFSDNVSEKQNYDESNGFVDFKIHFDNHQGSLVKMISSNEQEYTENIRYLSFDVYKDCMIVCDGDSIVPLGHIWETAFEGEIRIRLFFDPNEIEKIKNSDHTEFIFNDKLYEAGRIKLNLNN